MTTSLAAQLKKLAVPDAQISLSTDFKQASFLYDDKEAAKFDKQHFYNIGVNGLQQLIAKDERFMEFEKNLFSPSSQSIQRLMQSSIVNKQLDETITRFLLLLSPYMQLREAHKALEWLVNRYNIHLRNVDVLMMCLLPFHDQEPFIMGLRLLKMNTKSCNQWRWLESIKNANTYLPQKTLVSHCRSANGFMGFVCNMLSKHIEVNKGSAGKPSPKHLVRVISFFTQTVLGVIMDGSPSEQLISVLIPTLSAGFKVKGLPDYTVSSYMIFSQLLTSCTFSESLLSSILNVISKNIVPDLLQSALSVIVLMFQKQEISKVSKKALRYLSRNHSFITVISSLSENVKVEPFLTPFLSALTSSALKKYVESGSTSESGTDSEDAPRVSPLSLLLNVLTSVPLEKKSVAVVVRTVINWFHANASSDSLMEIDEEYEAKEGPFQVFRLLEKRYSSILDTTISEMLKADESGEVKNVVENLQLQSVAMAQRDMKSDPLTFMTVCLNHHHNTVRKQAVQKLLQDPFGMQDRQSLQSAILLRLQDDDLDVVDAVLQDPKNLWELFENQQLLYATLVKKLKSLGGSGEGSSDLRQKVLQAICCMPKSEDLNIVEIAVLIISYMVPLHSNDLAVLQNLKFEVAVFIPLLHHLQKGWLKEINVLQKKLKDEELTSTLTVKLVEQIATYINKHKPIEEMKSLYECVSKTPRPGCALMVLALVNVSLIRQIKALDVKTTLQRLLMTSIKEFTLTTKLVSFKKKEVPNYSSAEVAVTSCLCQLETRSQLDVDFVAFCLENLNLNGIPASLKDKHFWQLSEDSSVENNWLWTVVTLFNFLLEMSSNSNNHVSTLSQNVSCHLLKVLGSAHSLMKVLCLLWIGKVDKCISVANQARSLQFADVYIKSLTKEDKAKLACDENISVLPCILALMSGKSEKVRHVSFNLMASLSDSSGNSTDIFKWFATNLLSYRQEVENDVAFLSQVLQNILEGESNADPPPSKRRKTSSSKPPMSSTGLHYLMDVLVDPATPSVMRLALLNAFSRLDSSESFVSLMGFLKMLLDKSGDKDTPDETATLRLSIKLVLQHVTPNIAQCITIKSDCLKVLQQALNCTDVVLASGESVQILTAAQLSRQLMASLPPGSCQAIFSHLLEIMTTSPNTAMVRACRKVIKHMKLNSKLVVDEMATVLGKELATTVRETKKQKVQAIVDEGSDVLESNAWKRIITLLEMIQNKKKIINAEQLVPVAFQVLGKVLELEAKTSGEYIKQLLLGTIYKVCSAKHANQENDENSEAAVTGEHLSMETIVQCIRSSDNPHTHHQALLLLSVAAKIAPGLLLHNMMSVFTFMGASILRQDDEYSFHVIERILENVIPAIRMACEEKSKESKSAKKKKPSKSESSESRSEEMMTVVLRVFVDAIPHIPSHRKIMLFQKLLTVVGVDSYLWRVILLVIDNVVQRPKTEQPEDEQTSGPLTTSDMEFLSSLCEAFPSVQYFKCVTNAINYLMQVPDEVATESATLMIKTKKEMTKIEDMSKADMEIFSTQHHTAKQTRHFKYGSVYALAQLMSSQHLVAQLSQTEPETFLDQYQGMMETVLQFIGQVTKSHDEHQQDSSARFWKIFQHKCHDLLDNMVNLLPDSMFMKVISGLMDHPLAMVQKRSMDLLNVKLQYYKDSGIYPQQKEMLLDIVNKLEVIVRQTLLPKGKGLPRDDQVVNGQTAIYGLKVLCRILGEANREPFLDVLKLCVKALSRHEDNGTVSASAMLCIAEVVSCAKMHAIEHLEALMPLVISQLRTPTISSHEVLLLAAITSLQKIIEAVPLFLSPYLSDIVVQVCIINSEVHTDVHKPVIVQKIKLISSTLATVTATRTFLPVLQKSFTTLQDKLSDCADCMMTMLKDHIDNMSREDMATFSQDLLKFFFVCFNIRTEMSEMKTSDLILVEGFVIEAFVALVFKLSEVQFKPMLLQLYCWATDEEASKDRVLTFYRLCSSLAEKLKNLFTLFAGHILKHSTEVLDANNKSKTDCTYFGKGKKARRKSCSLVEYILSCLQKTFVHDTEGFMNNERFDVVMQPIVDQVENTLGKPDVAQERIEKFLVPCISSLAAAAKDDSLWKDMNYQILLKTRSKSDKVRMWALSAVDALHKQLGEDYTQLVAETIPFIAELMEDESDEVEKYTQKVIAAMEISVGENLQEYF